MYLTVRKPQNRLGFFNGNFDRMFEDFFNVSPRTEESRDWSPRADVHEAEGEYLVQLDLPGVDKKDVTVKLEDNVLTISGERKSEQESDEKGYHRTERFHGSFSRAFRLNQDVDVEKIKASYNNGVLELSIPKSEQVKPRQIEIN